MSRRVKRTTSLLATLSLLAGSTYLFGWSDFFPVKKITYQDSENKIVSQLKLEIGKSPSVITVGQPLARVDKRAIASRLRNLVWVESVNISRNFISGEVKIDVEPRDAIAVLEESSMTQIGFLDKNLEIFYLAADQVADAQAAGQVDWSGLPKLKIANQSELKSDVALLLEELSRANAKVLYLSAPSRDKFRSKVDIAGRELDVFWGSVNEFPLKFEVLVRLMALKENRRAKEFDLSTPLSPVVGP
ncbi:MAG: cell division protein FtsQ/DivIB [Actinomycetales bacterium]